MMKVSFNFVFLLFAVLFIASCKDDDTTTTNSPDEEVITDEPIATLATEREESVANILTNDGVEKIWRFEQAALTNNSGTIDITSNFNVSDDEFVFSGNASNGQLEWRRGNDINIEGNTNQETLLDNYLSPKGSSFSFAPDSSTELTALDGEMVFTLVDATTITGTLSFTNGRSLVGETIDFTLTTKQAEDYANTPETGLVFNEVATFMAYPQFGQQHNSALIGSYSDNSLFITYRNDCSAPNRSRIIKYNISTNSFTERNDDWMDFFTHKANIVSNELVITGGQNIYTYDLDLSSEPEITPHNAPILSRYGTATIDNDIYVIGGDLDETADKLRKINSSTGALDVVANIPTPKVHAGGEFVNDKLYIFSGREAFFDFNTITPTSYIYDLTSDSFTSFEMPVALANSHAARFQNLIYVIGDTQEDTDNDGGVDNHDIWMGVYNTLTDEITELSHNLDNSDNFSYVHSMTIFNDNLYVVYGSILDVDNDPDCPMVNWSIQSVSLN